MPEDKIHAREINSLRIAAQGWPRSRKDAKGDERSHAKTQKGLGVYEKSRSSFLVKDFSRTASVASSITL